MNEKEFMKQVSEFNMPDLLEVKESCMNQLNMEQEKSYNISRLSVMVAAMIIICFCVLPVNSLAKNIVEHIITILNLNDNALELGNMEEINIRIPDDCEEVKNDGVTYLTKAYHTLTDLTQDLQVGFYAWIGMDQFFENGIMLNIVRNDYGRIALLYDVTGKTVMDKDMAVAALQSVDMFVYFPLSKDTSVGDLMLQNEQLRYSTIDDAGNIEQYRQNTEYELIEQYKSKALDTMITVISSKSDTKGSGDLGEFSESDTLYYLYFTLDGMCYQVNCVGPLDKVHDVVENIEKTDVADTDKYNSPLLSE